MSKVLQEPYYLDKDQQTELELAYSTLQPSELTKYKDLERTVSNAFVEKWGTYLSDEQRQYFTEPQALFVSHDDAEQFFEQWDEGVHQITEENIDDISIGDQVYLGYTVEEHEHSEESGSEKQLVISPRHFWAGRVPVFPVTEADLAMNPEKKWLMSQSGFDKLTDTMSITDAFQAIYPFAQTNNLGAMIVHEKVHGIQLPALPLPIQEAAAHFYDREVFQRKGWMYEGQSNIWLLADLYGECISEIGDDLHRFIFGNLNDPEREKEILEQLKVKFSAERIHELSTYSEYGDSWPMPWRWVHWQVEPKEKVLAGLKRHHGLRRK